MQTQTIHAPLLFRLYVRLGLLARAHLLAVRSVCLFYWLEPLLLRMRRATKLDTATWARVFPRGRRLVRLPVHRSGGEPRVRSGATPRATLSAAGLATAGLYTNLITFGVGVTREVARERAMGSIKCRSSERTSEVEIATTSPATRRLPSEAGAGLPEVSRSLAALTGGTSSSIRPYIERSTAAACTMALEMGCWRGSRSR